jgi:hypothetical protein
MLIAAAVCPHPPLLIPEATGAAGPEATGAAGAGDAELGRLRAACDQAVAALLAEGPDVIVVVGTDPKTARTTQYPPDAVASLHEFSVPFTVGGPSGQPDGSSALPLSLTIAKWLLSRAAAGPGAPRAAWWGIAADAAPAGCLELGDKLAALAPRVAMLAMGDGPGRRACGAPGAADPEADRYDDQVAASLAAADPGALAALDPGQDGRLCIAGRAAWQVLAGAAGRDRFDAIVRYRGVPYEVTYVVASWRRRA